ncbi:hypothetical protein HYU93_04705 [Candidatus Daviesbacteria bacterium]|nr:hypothetical protein [Candidatus Daviesbacteria bacterium]
MQSEGERLASLVYTPEGQQQVAQVKTTITQIVDATTKQPKLETVHPGFDRSPVAIAEVRQRNEQLLQAWQQRKTARIEALLRGETMTHLEANAYLAQILNREPLPTRDIEESNKRQNLLDQFNRQRQVIGRMLLYRDSEQLPIGSRYLLVNAKRLKFYKISTNEAQISFAKGWDGTKNSLQEKSTNPNHVTSSEARIILEQLNSVQQTGTALNNLLHEPVQFSTYSEAIANFVRFRARIGERLFLGTNHEHSQAEMQFIDSYIEDIVNRHITVVFIEQGGLTAKDNLDRWLYENGYTQTANTVVGELSHLAQDLSSKGIRVLNMDLRFNPSALPFALKRFGLERTIRDLNWDLSFKAASFLNADTAQMDQNRIPEIITRLIIQAGGQTTQEQVASLIQGRDWTNDDYFTDSDREEYMANIIQGEKIAVAAHSAHASALLARLHGNQQVDNLNISTDLNKIDRVVAETKRRSSN